MYPFNTLKDSLITELEKLKKSLEVGQLFTDLDSFIQELRELHKFHETILKIEEKDFHACVNTQLAPLIRKIFKKIKPIDNMSDRLSKCQYPQYFKEINDNEDNIEFNILFTTRYLEAFIDEFDTLTHWILEKTLETLINTLPENKKVKLGVEIVIAMLDELALLRNKNEKESIIKELQNKLDESSELTPNGKCKLMFLFFYEASFFSLIDHQGVNPIDAIMKGRKDRYFGFKKYTPDDIIFLDKIKNELKPKVLPTVPSQSDNYSESNINCVSMKRRNNAYNTVLCNSNNGYLLDFEQRQNLMTLYSRFLNHRTLLHHEISTCSEHSEISACSEHKLFTNNSILFLNVVLEAFDQLFKPATLVQGAGTPLAKFKEIVNLAVTQAKISHDVIQQTKFFSDESKKILYKLLNLKDELHTPESLFQSQAFDLTASYDAIQTFIKRLKELCQMARFYAEFASETQQLDRLSKSISKFTDQDYRSIFSALLVIQSLKFSVTDIVTNIENSFKPLGETTDDPDMGMEYEALFNSVQKFKTLFIVQDNAHINNLNQCVCDIIKSLIEFTIEVQKTLWSLLEKELLENEKTELGLTLFGEMFSKFFSPNEKTEKLKQFLIKLFQIPNERFLTEAEKYNLIVKIVERACRVRVDQSNEERNKVSFTSLMDIVLSNNKNNRPRFNDIEEECVLTQIRSQLKENNFFDIEPISMQSINDSYKRLTQGIEIYNKVFHNYLLLFEKKKSLEKLRKDFIPHFVDHLLRHENNQKNSDRHPLNSVHIAFDKLFVNCIKNTGVFRSDVIVLKAELLSACLDPEITKSTKEFLENACHQIGQMLLLNPRNENKWALTPHSQFFTPENDDRQIALWSSSFTSCKFS